MKLRIFTSKLLIVPLSFAALSLTSCSYPGGPGQFVKTKQYGSRTSIRIDQDATKKLLEFNLSPRDVKFARCVAAGDTALAQKYLTATNVNKPIDGLPPLSVAARFGNAEMANMLLASGANPKAKSANGDSAAGIAARSGYKALANKLVSNGAGTSQDVTSGSRYYASNQRRIEEGNKRAMAFALDLIGAMMSRGNGGGSGSGRCPSCNDSGYVAHSYLPGATQICGDCAGRGRQRLF